MPMVQAYKPCKKLVDCHHGTKLSYLLVWQFSKDTKLYSRYVNDISEDKCTKAPTFVHQEKCN